MAETAQAIPPLLPAREIYRRPAFETPTSIEWFRHSAFFLLTFISTTFAGIVIASPQIDVPEPAINGLLSYITYVPEYYLRTIGALLAFSISHPPILAEGVTFSVALLSILLAHEMGHYLACRHYGVSATLPFFVPAPPLFLAGTFGAFIKMKSPIPTRRALFDIGLAGPLAGFVVLLPVALVGLLTLQPAAPSQVEGAVVIFNDPILFRIIARFTGVNLADAVPNPFYMAAWIGLVVTSLNLMPVGQLDGGHGTLALFGQRSHKIIGRVAFVSMAVISVLGFIWHGSPSGFLYTVLLAVMLKVKHPTPERMEPLGRSRIIVGIVTLLVFVLSFWPFPITLT